jgi:hypothetical protein
LLLIDVYTISQLYSLAILPQLSVCDEDVLKTLFTDLILNNASFDGSKFTETLQLIQDRYDCLGIHCSLVGTSTSADSTWPSCVDTTAPDYIPALAGYEPFSKASTELAKIDLDISTILSFIVMEANGAAWDIFNNGRNVVGNDGSYVSLAKLKVPQNPTVIDMFSQDNLALTEKIVQGIDYFENLTPLQNSAAASLSIATTDLHVAILDNMYQAIQSCRDGNDSLVVRALMDRAVALMIGWTEGRLETGSDIDGHLLYQIAQEVCEHFSSCGENGNSKINNRIILAFDNADGIISLQDCDKLEEEVGIIEDYLQAIILDNFAYHVKSVAQDERHFLLAHVSAYAILPLMRTLDSSSATVLESTVGAFPNDSYSSDSSETLYSALKSYVDIKGIDCEILASPICEGLTSSDIDEGSIAAPNDSGLTLAAGEYMPFTDVSYLSDLSLVVKNMCYSQDSMAAKALYTTNYESLGFSLQSLSLTAKDVMSNEVLFNQYVYSFVDDVDKTDGSLLFDQLPAQEYGNTIISDAIDDNVALGCLSVKGEARTTSFITSRRYF